MVSGGLLLIFEESENNRLYDVDSQIGLLLRFPPERVKKRTSGIPCPPEAGRQCRPRLPGVQNGTVRTLSRGRPRTETRWSRTIRQVRASPAAQAAPGASERPSAGDGLHQGARVGRRRAGAGAERGHRIAGPRPLLRRAARPRTGGIRASARPAPSSALESAAICVPSL
ncbi:hypothetical protein GCM10009605_32080 [Nocardiopsis composta]